MKYYWSELNGISFNNCNCFNGYWSVNFPQCGEKDDIATISIHEDDMEVVPIMHAIENERIKAKFGD